MSNPGKILILAGSLMLLAGFVVLFMDKLPFGLGKLPGDIFIKRERFTFFAPITSMIIISIVLSVILNLVSRFFR